MIDLGDLIVNLSILGITPGGGIPGGGTVTSVATGTGLTGGTITSTGSISLAPITTKFLLANLAGGSAAPLPHSLTAIFDSIFGTTQGTLLYRNATVWTTLAPAVSTNLFLRSGGASANPVWDIPVAGGFDPAQTIYFAPQGGNDSNSGTLASPYLTLSKAVTEAQAAIVGGDDFVQIIGLGVGTDTSNVSITESGIDIYAPMIAHNPATGDALTVELTSSPGSGSYINVVLASSAVESGADCLNLIDTVGGFATVTRFTYLGQCDGNVTLEKKAEVNTTFISGTLVANEAGTNVVTTEGIGVISQQTRLNMEGITFGAGGGAIQGPMNITNLWRYPMRKIVYITDDIILSGQDSGYLYINNTTNNYSVTLPDTTAQGTPAFLIGYEATFLNANTGSILFEAGGAASLVGATELTGIGQRANCTLMAANEWELDAVSVTAFNAALTYYFGPGGNDSNIGTQGSPFLTLDKAVTEAEAAIVLGASFVNIVGLGTGVDTSNISITQSGINIYAPTIALNPATGDALTVDLSGAASASYIDVTLASIAVEPGAKALNLIAIFGGNDSVTRFNILGASTGDVYLGVKCEYTTTIITGLLTAVEAGTNVTTQYGIGSQTQETRLNLEGMTFGAGGGNIHGEMNVTNRWRYPMRKIIDMSGDVTLSATQSGFLFVNSSSSTYTVTLPDTTGQGTPPFVIGYESTFLNVGSGAIAFVADGAATLVGATTLDQVAQRADCTLIADNEWELDNAGGSAPFVPYQYNSALWIDLANGNDSNSGKSIEEPLLTFQEAINIAGATPTVIYFVNGGYESGTVASISGTSCNIYVVAPGVALQGTYHFQNSNDIFSLNADQVYNVTVDSDQPCSISARNVSTITDNSGGLVITATSQITGYVFNGVSGSGGTVSLTAPDLNVTFTPNRNVTATIWCNNLTFDSTFGTVASNYTITAMLGLFTQTGADNFFTQVSALGAPASISGGQFSGNLGGTFFGGLSVGSTAGVKNYDFATAAPTAANQVQVSSGAGPSATSSWAALTLPASTVCLPLTAFSYYNKYHDTASDLWFQTNTLNGSILSGTLNQDMGTVPINLAAGVWRVTVCAWADGNGGIIDFVFNGSTNSIDTYTIINNETLSWDTTIAADGAYGFQIINNGKNASSGGYNMYFNAGYITLVKIA